MSSRFQQLYEKAVTGSERFTNFEPLADFMLYALGHKKECLLYVDRLESELLGRGLLQKRIAKRGDFVESRNFRIPEFNRMLYYISLIREPFYVDLGR